MKEYAEKFYKSKEWKSTRDLYMSSINYICERCGKPAVICHHKRYLTPTNITDYSISLNFDNLEGLCQDCHNKQHSCKYKNAKPLFNTKGELIGVKENAEMKEFKKLQEQVKNLNPPQFKNSEDS